jgi:hypothetical protein
MHIGQSGDAPRVSRTYVVALYRKSDRQVVHLHTTTVFEGARTVTEQEATELAKQRAAHHGHTVADLEVLVVEKLPQQVGTLRVDTDEARLIVGEPDQRRPGQRRTR